MLSVIHEVLVMLFREQPRLAVTLLEQQAKRGGPALPGFTAIQVRDGSLPDIVGAEFSADAVVVLEDEGRPVFVIVLEVQRDCDADKRRSWPVYGASTRARYRCPSCVLVICPDPRVARWAAEPIPLGSPGCTYQPVVISADGIPKVVDDEVARELPELAVLSATTHARSDDGAAIALAAIKGLGNPRLDPDTAGMYLDIILGGLNDAARSELERRMQIQGYEYQSDFAKRYFRKGKESGKEEGIALGEERGIALGEERGIVLGKREGILTILDARGLTVSDEERSAILGCDDLAQLDLWLRRAATAESTAGLFDTSM